MTAPKVAEGDPMLWADLRAGLPEVWSALLGTLEEIVRRTTRQQSLPAEVLTELRQQVVSDLLGRLQQPDGAPRNVYGYLQALSRTALTGYIRQHKRQRAALDVSGLELAAGADITEQLQEEELLMAFRDCRSGLEPGDLELVRLRFEEGLILRQVALKIFADDGEASRKRAAYQLHQAMGRLLICLRRKGFVP